MRQVKEMIEAEQHMLDLAVSNIQDGALYDQQNAKCLRDIFPRVQVNKAVISRYILEGNSSDVYRILLQGGKMYFYAKKDVKLLNEDLGGFVGRRLKQLQKSRQNRAGYAKNNAQYLQQTQREEQEIAELDRRVKAGEISEVEADQKIYEIRSKQEELRLRGYLDDTDYEAGINFMTAMQNKIESKKGSARTEQIDRYLKFLGHDFDRVFLELKKFNDNIQNIADDEEARKQYIEKLKADTKEKDQNEPIIKYLESIVTKKWKQLTPYEWIKMQVEMDPQHYGLDLKKDKDLLDILKNLQQKDGMEALEGERVKRLFTRTLGKEAELFGQQCERGGIDDSAILAPNNTATSRLATFLNFNDIAATSIKCMMKNRDDDQYEMYTLSEEVLGDELLSIVEQKEKEGATLRYSPESIRQTVRLQMFDLLCLQTDRHGRNIKCQVKKDGKNWTITSVKAYDHDQSFGSKSLDEYFVEQTDPVTGHKYTAQPGFLMPHKMVVDKRDPLFAFISNRFMNGMEDPTLDRITVPKPHQPYEYENLPHTKFEWQVKRANREYMFDLVRAEFALGSGTNARKESAIRNMLKEMYPEKVKAIDEFFEVLRVLGEEYFDVDNRYYKFAPPREVADDQKTGHAVRILKYLKKLKNCSEQLNLVEFEKKAEAYRREHGMEHSPLVLSLSNQSEYRANMCRSDGFFDYMLQHFMYSLKMQFATNQEYMVALEEEEKKERLETLKKNLQKNPGSSDTTELDKLQEFYKLCGVGEDKIVVPTMLHMDAEAYRQIKRVAEKETDTVDGLMRELSWDEKKRKALITRAKELVAMKETTEKFLNLCADMMGLPKDHIFRKFLLEKEDYKKIKSLTDLVIDPSKSYFSIEDPNFLLSDPVYQKYLPKEVKKRMMERLNQLRKEPRQKLGEMQGEYKPLVSNEVDNGEAA